MRQVLIAMVFVLFPLFAFGDVFEGRFPDKTGDFVEIKALGKRVYELRKTVIENGKERVILGRGVVVNGKLYGKFGGTRRGRSFRSRLGELGGGDGEIDVTLGELILTRQEAERRKAEDELKEKARERGFEEPKPIDFSKMASPFARPDLVAMKASGSSQKGVLKKEEPGQDRASGEEKEKGGMPPAVPGALALLALAAARRRRLRFAPGVKKVGGAVYREVLPKILGALTFLGRDQGLRAELSERGVGVASRLAARLRSLPRPEGLLVYADALRDLGRRGTVNRFRRQTIRTAERLEGLAKAIDETLKVAVRDGRKDIAFLEQEKELNRIIDELERESSRDVFFSREILKVRGDDPRNRIIDVWFDPTAQFTRGGVFNKAFGYGKLVTYAVFDSVLGTLSRTDANIRDHNNGLIDDAESKSREINGVVNDFAKLGITVIASSIRPAVKLSKLGKVGFGLAVDLPAAAANLTVDAVTGKGRGEFILTNGDLAKEGGMVVLNALLSPAGGVKLTGAVPRSARRQLFRKIATEQAQDAVLGKLLDQAMAKKPKDGAREPVKSR